LLTFVHKNIGGSFLGHSLHDCAILSGMYSDARVVISEVDCLFVELTANVSADSAVMSYCGCRERKCADTIGTVPVPWAGHFQCKNIFLTKIYESSFIKQHSETVIV